MSFDLHLSACYFLTMLFYCNTARLFLFVEMHDVCVETISAVGQYLIMHTYFPYFYV